MKPTIFAISVVIVSLIRATTGADTDLSFWKPFGQSIKDLDASEQGPLLSLSGNGKILASVAANSVLVFQYDDSKKTWEEQTKFAPDYQNNSTIRFLSLSPNGEFVAVRHGGSTVSIHAVYDHNTRLGNDIDDCSGQHIQLYDQQYLAMSCEAYNNHRGLARVYQFVPNEKQWLPIISIAGDEPGDGFGWRVALDTSMTSGNRLFRMAVSAPLANQETGLVRVYDVFRGGSYQSVGKDINGKEIGERFGSTLVLAQTSNSIMAVGAPNYANTGILRGAIRLFAFQRSPFRSAWEETQEIIGENDYDSVGTSIAMTPDAGRIALSSSGHEYKNSWTRVYHSSVVSLPAFELMSTLENESDLTQCGKGLSLSRSGSILASGCVNQKTTTGRGIPSGAVTISIDYSPFCSSSRTLLEDAFIDRQVCHDAYDAVADERACESILMSQHGGDGSCVWIEPPTATPSRTASESPSVPPSSRQITSLPTFNPTSRPDFSSTLSGLEGCPCDELGRCTDLPLSDGSNLGLCIIGRNRKMQLVGVTALHLELGSLRSIVINEDGSRVDDVSAFCSIDSCTIRTPVDPEFFIGNGTGSSLVASGTILVAFPGLSRKLRGNPTETRDVGAFSISCPLRSRNSDASKSDQSIDDEPVSGVKLFVTLTLMMLVVMGCCWCFTRKDGAKRGCRHKLR